MGGWGSVWVGKAGALLEEKGDREKVQENCRHAEFAGGKDGDGGDAQDPRQDEATDAQPRPHDGRGDPLDEP